jgi:hypothetical protein
MNVAKSNSCAASNNNKFTNEGILNSQTDFRKMVPCFKNKSIAAMTALHHDSASKRGCIMPSHELMVAQAI